MEHEQAGSLTMPGIGLGTLGNQGEEAATLVEAALAAGYRHIDTGRYYGNEDAVGEGLQRSSVPRDQVLLVTKLLHPKTPPMTDLQAELEHSLRLLQTDYVDLLLIHWPHPDVSLEWALGEFAVLREQGKIREYGVSNFPVALVHEATAQVDGVVVNQVEYHPYLGQQRLLEAMKPLGMTLTAHTPLGRGAVVDDPVLREIGAGRGLSAVQVALRWLVQQDGVVAIPGADNVDQLRQNLAVCELSLSDDEIRAIAELQRGERIVDPPHAPDWDPAD